MNGPHDMGGMQTFGPIRPAENDAASHAAWEERIAAIWSAMGTWRKWNIDSGRQARESLPPAEYLSLSYGQLRYAQALKLIVERGFLTPAEIERGKAAKASPKLTPALSAEQVPAYWRNGAPKSRNVAVDAGFHVGQRVRARNVHPLTHTRLPRYARGRVGVIERDRGVFVFPDTNAQDLGEKPQHVYSVRFLARELWGDQANAFDTVMIDMWDDYLESA
jgi:nitrile hydratase subunit beta